VDVVGVIDASLSPINTNANVDVKGKKKSWGVIKRQKKRKGL
jgi:hypothetical protein